MHTIIIIEHNPEELEALVRLFTNWPNEVTVLSAPDIQSAASIMSRSKIDLVVCDLTQPESCGLEDFATLTRTFPLAPYLTLTTAKSATVEQARQKGASYCLAKPVNPAEILDHAAKLLEVTGSGTVKGIPIYSFLQMLETE